MLYSSHNILLDVLSDILLDAETDMLNNSNYVAKHGLERDLTTSLLISLTIRCPQIVHIRAMKDES